MLRHLLLRGGGAGRRGGGAVPPAERPPGGLWAGALASCLPAETARDGLFGQALLTQARELDPDQAGAWINELARIGERHPDALALIPVLAAPPSEPDSEPEEDSDGAD